MKRLLSALAVTIIVGALALVIPAAPASALDLCHGVGSATTPPLTYPGLSNAANGPFGFALETGVCISGANLSAQGNLTGWCGLSSGGGITNTGYDFHYLGIGGLLLVTGETNGSVVAAPNVAEGQSCTTGATSFVIAGGAAMTGCGVGVLANFTTGPPPVLDVHTHLNCLIP